MIVLCSNVGNYHYQESNPDFVSILYKGAGGPVFRHPIWIDAVEHIMDRCPSDELILILGREAADTVDGNVCLKRFNGHIVGIWRGADEFARKNGLHGLFTGELVTNPMEARDRGFMTLQIHIDEWTEYVFTCLRKLFDENTPLEQVPEKLKAMSLQDRKYSCERIYNSFIYL